MRRAAFPAFLVLWSGPSVIGTSAPAIAGPVGAAATGGGPVGNETGLPIPRYVTLRASEVNVRAGPGVRYPIEWVYQRQHLPVEVVAEFDTLRKPRDPRNGSAACRVEVGQDWYNSVGA